MTVESLNVALALLIITVSGWFFLRDLFHALRVRAQRAELEYQIGVLERVDARVAHEMAAHYGAGSDN